MEIPTSGYGRNTGSRDYYIHMMKDATDPGLTLLSRNDWNGARFVFRAVWNRGEKTSPALWKRFLGAGKEDYFIQRGTPWKPMGMEEIGGGL